MIDCIGFIYALAESATKDRVAIKGYTANSNRPWWLIWVPYFEKGYPITNEHCHFLDRITKKYFCPNVTIKYRHRTTKQYV